MLSIKFGINTNCLCNGRDTLFSQPSSHDLGGLVLRARCIQFLLDSGFWISNDKSKLISPNKPAYNIAQCTYGDENIYHIGDLKGIFWFPDWEKESIIGERFFRKDSIQVHITPEGTVVMSITDIVNKSPEDVIKELNETLLG